MSCSSLRFAVLALTVITIATLGTAAPARAQLRPAPKESPSGPPIYPDSGVRPPRVRVEGPLRPGTRQKPILAIKRARPQPLPATAPLVLTGEEFKGGTVSVFFSPNGGISEALVREIGDAKKTVEIQSLQLISPQFMRAVLGAHERGVKVTVIVDESSIRAYQAGLRYLVPPLVRVFANNRQASFSGNVILIDSETVITGAYRLSLPTDDGASTNLMIIKRVPTMAAAYLGDFKRRLAESRLFERIDLSQEAARPSNSIIEEYLEFLEQAEAPIEVAGFLDAEFGGLTVEFPKVTVTDPQLKRYVGSRLSLSMILTENGLPLEVRVTKGSGSPVIDQQAVAMIQKLTFKPRAGGDRRLIRTPLDFDLDIVGPEKGLSGR